MSGMLPSVDIAAEGVTHALQLAGDATAAHDGDVE